MYTPEQEKTLIKELQNSTTDYDSYFEDIIFSTLDRLGFADTEEFVYVADMQVEKHRWHARVKSIFKINDYFVAVEYDEPLTEMQEGQSTNPEFYYVKPYTVETIKYERRA